MKAIHLRAARERKGWTQEQLEDISGVPQAVISRLETTGTAALFETVTRLADALGVEAQALRFGPDGKKSERLSA